MVALHRERPVIFAGEDRPKVAVAHPRAVAGAQIAPVRPGNDDVADPGDRVVVEADAGRFENTFTYPSGSGLGVEFGDGGIVSGDQ